MVNMQEEENIVEIMPPLTPDLDANKKQAMIANWIEI
jgi:hypothetical protein